MTCSATRRSTSCTVREAIEAEWNIPFVSELYGYITNGGTFTGLNLMSLLLAIPATAFYKLVYKVAPFQTPADVTTFEQNFTTANILNAWGIGPTAPKVTETAPSGSATTTDT